MIALRAQFALLLLAMTAYAADSTDHLNDIVVKGQIWCPSEYGQLDPRRPNPLLIAQGQLGDLIYANVETALRRAIALGRSERLTLEGQIALVYPELKSAGLKEQAAIDAVNKMIEGGVLGQARSPLIDLARAYHSLTTTQRVTSLEGRNLSDYQSTMAERTSKKLAVMEEWLPPLDGASVVDVGTGTGHVPATLAQKHKGAKFIGIDLSPEMVASARRDHADSGAEFHQVEANGTWPGGPHDAALFVSVIHEVYSYAGEKAFQGMLKNTNANLKKGGRIIIKDFNGPAEPNKLVVLTQAKDKLRDPDLAPYSFSDFVRAIAELRGDVKIRIKKVTDTEIQYETPMWLAYEYMYHLKYLKSSPKEVMEKYGFWNAASARKSLEDAGFKVVHLKEFDDGNVVETRLKGSLSLSDPTTGEPLDYPVRKLIIVGEKQ